MIGLVAHAVARLSGRDAVGVDRFVCCFPLRGCGAVFAVFIAFAVVVF